MTRLYAGWAPGDALAFGYSLGLTASHSDVSDYLVMSRREHFKNEVAHVAGRGNCEWQDQVDYLSDERNKRVLAEATANE